MRTLVLVDILNLIFISFHSVGKQVEELSEENIGFFYHFFLNKFHVIVKTYGKVVACWDGKNSTKWRRSIFPDYKMNREKRNQDPSYKFLISKLDEIKGLLSLYPIKQVDVEEVEADDVIYTLCEKYHEGNNIIVISSDVDLTQIALKFNNVEIYNPIKKRTLTPYKYIIEQKCMVGDGSDNIPGLYRIGEKTFEKIMKDPKLLREKVLNKSGNVKAYKLFRRIVDLSLLPNDLRKRILDKDQEEQYNTFKPDEIEFFAFNRNMKDLLDRWLTIKEEIRNAKE